MGGFKKGWLLTIPCILTELEPLRGENSSKADRNLSTQTQGCNYFKRASTNY